MVVNRLRRNLEEFRLQGVSDEEAERTMVERRDAEGDGRQRARVNRETRRRQQAEERRARVQYRRDNQMSSREARQFITEEMEYSRDQRRRAQEDARRFENEFGFTKMDQGTLRRRSAALGELYRRGESTPEQEREYISGLRVGVYDPVQAQDGDDAARMERINTAHRFTINQFQQHSINEETGLSQYQTEAVLKKPDFRPSAGDTMRVGGSFMARSAGALTGAAYFQREAAERGIAGGGMVEEIRMLAEQLEQNGYEGDAYKQAQTIVFRAARERDPNAAMVGDVAGFIAPGGVVAKGGQTVGRGLTAGYNAMRGGRAVGSGTYRGVLARTSAGWGLQGAAYEATTGKLAREEMALKEIDDLSAENIGAIGMMTGLSAGLGIAASPIYRTARAGVVSLTPKSVRGAIDRIFKLQSRENLEAASRWVPRNRSEELTVQNLRRAGYAQEDIPMLMMAAKKSGKSPEAVYEDSKVRALELVSEALRRSGLTPEDINQRIAAAQSSNGLNHNFLIGLMLQAGRVAEEGGGRALDNLLIGLTTVQGEFKRRAADALRARNRALGRSVRGDVEAATGVNAATAIERLGQLARQTKDEGSFKYQALKGVELDDEGWSRLSQIDEFDESLIDNLDKFVPDAVTLTNSSKMIDPEMANVYRELKNLEQRGLRGSKPSFQALVAIDQAITENLRGVATDGVKRAATKALQRGLRQVLDDPKYGYVPARNAWRKTKATSKAAEDLKNFFQRGKSPEELDRIVDSMDDEALSEAYIIGLVKGLDDKLKEATNLGGLKRPLMGSDAADERRTTLMNWAKTRLAGRYTPEELEAMAAGRARLEGGEVPVTYKTLAGEEVTETLPVVGSMNEAQIYADEAAQYYAGSQTSSRQEALKDLNLMDTDDVLSTLVDAQTMSSAFLMRRLGRAAVDRILRSDIYENDVNRELADMLFEMDPAKMRKTLEDLERIRNARNPKKKRAAAKAARIKRVVKDAEKATAGRTAGEAIDDLGVQVDGKSARLAKALGEPIVIEDVGNGQVVVRRSPEPLPGRAPEAQPQLDMSDEARMARAKAQGFDTDTVVYHGTGRLGNFEEGFDPALSGQGNDQYGSGFYLTTDPAEASMYAGGQKGQGSAGVIPAYTKIKNPIVIDGTEIQSLGGSSVSFTEEQVYQIMRRNPDIYDLEKSPIGDWVDIWSEGRVTDKMLRDVAKNYAGPGRLQMIEGDLFRDNSGAFRRAVNEVTGIDGVVVKFGDKEHRIPWFPEQIRSIFARFDPRKISSRNLRASRASSDETIEGSPLKGADDPNLISTARPTAPGTKKGFGDPEEELLMQNTERMRMNPAAYEKAAKQLKEIPMMRGTTVRNADKIVGEFEEIASDNLAFVVEQAGPETIQSARQWYDTANMISTGVANRYGLPPEASHGIMAVFSPQTAWPINVARHERFIDMAFANPNELFATFPGEVDNMILVGRGKVAGQIKRREKGFWSKQSEADIRRMAETPFEQLRTKEDRFGKINLLDAVRNDPMVKDISPTGEILGDWGTITWGNTNITEKALRILANPTRGGVSGAMGPRGKVPSFYNNIAAPGSRAGISTIDTHSAGAATLFPAGSDDLVTKRAMGLGGAEGKPAAPDSAPTGTKGLYGVFSDAHLLAAKKTGLLPREVQSITWEEVRRLWGQGKKTTGLKRAVEHIWQTTSNKQEARRKIVDLAKARGIRNARMSAATTREGSGPITKSTLYGLIDPASFLTGSVAMMANAYVQMGDEAGAETYGLSAAIGGGLGLIGGRGIKGAWAVKTAANRMLTRLGQRNQVLEEFKVTNFVRSKDEALIARAQDLEAKGLDADDIWSQLKITKSPSGVWMEEVLSTAQIIGGGPFRKDKLSVKELQEAAEEISSLVNIKIVDDPRFMGGVEFQAAYQPNNNTIFINRAWQRGDVTDEELIAHELQHVVQDAQKLPVGGDSRTMRGLRKAIMREYEKDPEGASDVLTAQYLALFDPATGRLKTDEELYESLLGEAEARLAQRRTRNRPGSEKTMSRYDPYTYDNTRTFGIDKEADDVIPAYGRGRPKPQEPRAIAPIGRTTGGLRTDQQLKQIGKSVPAATSSASWGAYKDTRQVSQPPQTSRRGARPINTVRARPVPRTSSGMARIGAVPIPPRNSRS